MPKSRSSIAERVASAAEAALADHHYVSTLDVLFGMGWLDYASEARWRKGQVDFLESVVQPGWQRVLEAMALFRSWADSKGLLPTETPYVARTPGRDALRFSEDATDAVEQAFRTHWISPELSEKQRDRVVEKASRAPELVVISPLTSDWVCHRCGGTGSLLIMEQPGPACLKCNGLDDLEYLESGDARLTRRVKAKSPRHAVVVRFSRTRRRYERQGILVEPQVLADERRELESRPA